MNMVRFAVLSDTHLGCVQLGLTQRFYDFINAFDEAISKIIDYKPDFVIHAGDLFDRAEVMPQAEAKAVAILKKLADAGIPLYIIAGNHDLGPSRYGTETRLDAFEMAGLLKVLGKEHLYIEELDTEIVGIPYLNERLVENRKVLLSVRPKRNAKCKILVIHQAIKGVINFQPSDVFVDLGEIPALGFDVVVSGHIHAPLARNVGNTTLIIPGSTERWSLDELEDKGIWFVEAGANGHVKAQFVKLNVRPVLHFEVDCTGLAPKDIAPMVKDKINEKIIPGAILRIVLTGKLREPGTVDLDDLEKQAIKRGALDVKIVNTLQSGDLFPGAVSIEEVSKDLSAFFKSCLVGLGYNEDVATRRATLMDYLVGALSGKEKPETILDLLLKKMGVGEGWK